MAMALVKTSEDFISEEEYLAGEKISDKKYEYIDGKVYAMAGTSKNHNRIIRNIMIGLESAFTKNKSPCETFSSDIKVKISKPNNRFYYPDVVVTCDESNDENDYYTDNPILIVEVLSKSTDKMDKTMKMKDYLNMPSLQEYVLIEQNRCEIQVMRRCEHWQSFFYFLGDEIHFSSINISLSVADIYYQVNNSDMLSFQKTESDTKILP